MQGLVGKGGLVVPGHLAAARNEINVAERRQLLIRSAALFAAGLAANPKWIRDGKTVLIGQTNQLSLLTLGGRMQGTLSFFLILLVMFRTRAKKKPLRTKLAVDYTCICTAVVILFLQGYRIGFLRISKEDLEPLK